MKRDKVENKAGHKFAMYGIVNYLDCIYHCSVKRVRDSVEKKLRAKRHEVEYQRDRSGGEVVANGGNGGEAVTIHNVQQWNQYLVVGRWHFAIACALHVRETNAVSMRDEPYCGMRGRAFASCVFIARPGNNNRLLFITPAPNTRMLRSPAPRRDLFFAVPHHAE